MKFKNPKQKAMVLDHFTEKSFYRIFLTERHLTETPFDRTPFDRMPFDRNTILYISIHFYTISIHFMLAHSLFEGCFSNLSNLAYKITINNAQTKNSLGLILVTAFDLIFYR
jgi:hypothetical protein